MTTASRIIWRTIRVFNYPRCCMLNNNVTSLSSCVKINNKKNIILTSTRSISTSKYYYHENDVIEEEVKAKKKKIFIPKITLLSEKDEISVMTLDEAQKLAKRRALKLIKIVDFDTKTERPIYKLMNISDFIKEENKAKAEAKEVKENSIKEDKTITVSSKIGDHDLNTKIKSMLKMLGKRHGIRAVISVDGSQEKADEVRNKIIESCKEVAKVVTKSDAAHNFKVTMRPIMQKAKDKVLNDEKSNEPEQKEQE
ncbi:hypothetical protein HCN44_006346 [Aphidius gifuensis]|uniref:Translation initiation factor 3 N-terminal domain-containing protein n=1 Tax=Aphidius gifuensis TaxID=684658 RepID=A0A834XYP9_APHGI|nr:uncharacterized protein LOC122852227 [Aphidius gifuensis]KAF7993286.1 hypothetical protein HCN44_006346 [Aphidius gifuensis]